jgi:Phosphodiester glycosidase
MPVGVSRIVLCAVVGVVVWMGATVGAGWKLARASASVPLLASASQARYRPPRLAPLARPALPGEGVWRATGPPVWGGQPVLVTTFRPDPGSPGIAAYVAWLDHTRTQLALYPGVFEPPTSFPHAPSEIPWGQRWRLLATFNGGFKANAGAGGFAINGRAYSWLQRGLGTLVGYRDGRVDIITWQGGPTPPPQVAFARQNLPLIVNDGRPAPNVWDGWRWGATLGGASYVWRTGVGVDRHGNLIYTAADYQTAGTLAAILIHAGAVRAIELDINPMWPTLITYTHQRGLQPTKLVPNYLQPASRYLYPDSRDFFTVYRRLAGTTATVPFR